MDSHPILIAQHRLSCVLFIFLAAGLTTVIAEDPVSNRRRATSSLAPSPDSGRRAISFLRDVSPLLIEHCEACHGAEVSESNYRLDSYQHLTTSGDFGTLPVAAGRPEESELFRLISSDDVDQRMPKDGMPLSRNQIQLVQRWILEGAKFDGTDPNGPLRDQIPPVPYPPAPDKYPTTVAITALAFEGDGKSLWVGGYHELTVWDADTGQLLRRIGDVPERIYAIDMHPSRPIAAIAGGAPGRSGEVLLIDRNTGQRIDSVLRSERVVFDAEWDAKGHRIATAGEDGTVRLIQTEPLRELKKIENHVDWVMDVGWSDDDAKIASASRDRSAKLFDAGSGDLLAAYSGHGGAVYGVVVGTDGKRVYSAGSDAKIHIWDAADGTEKSTMGGHSDEILRLTRFESNLYSAAADGRVIRHKLSNHSIDRTFSGHTDPVYSLAFHTSTRRLATGFFDGTVRIWNVVDARLIANFTAAPGYAAADREPSPR
jgi:WD40 repeat protein